MLGGVEVVIEDLDTLADKRINSECETARNGECYVYEDGNTCPKMIDGEVVNPLWGVTKSGKARKRQPQACLSVVLERLGLSY